MDELATKAITLIPAGANLPPVQSNSVGLLFECAPDGSAMDLYPQAIGLTRLIGDFEDAKVKAYELARKLLADEPKFRGLQQLAIFEEIVIRELQRAFHLLHLHEFLVSQGFTQCDFAGDSEFSSGLTYVAAQLGGSLMVTAPPLAPSYTSWDRFRRSWQRVRSAGFSHRAAAREWHQVLERLDPYHRRARVKPERVQPKPNAIWFYTTAYTFTRIGQYYEPYFPQAFEYLVENPQTGGEPLRAARRPFTSVYAFGARHMEPSATELLATQQAIVTHLNAVRLSRIEIVARQLLLNSSFFQTFLARHLPRGLYATALFDHWVDATYPAALVVGNPVFESHALHAARLHGIPTILLQHGILGDYCQLSDPPVDHYVVRGTFWRDFLAAAPRARARVLEPAGGLSPSKHVTSERKAILFLTAPYRTDAFMHFADLDDILRVVLAGATDADSELIIRVHPMEEIGFYQSKISQWVQTRGIQVMVTYSQGAGLDELLNRATVAVTYCSTVFLDCLRHRVPIVSFGWHDFSYKRQIEAHGVFYFAEDLAGLSRLTARGLQGDLPAYAHSTKPFLADTPDKVLRDELAKLAQRAFIHQAPEACLLASLETFSQIK